MFTYLLYGSLVLIILLFLLQTWRLMGRSRDLAAATSSLVKQEKMASLGMMLAGIAHELNTPLGAVACTLDTRKRALSLLTEALGALENANDPAAAGEHLARARKALRVAQETEPVLDEAMNRAEELVKSLRLHGRGQTEQPAAVDVNPLLEGTLVLLRHELKNEVELDLDLGEVPPVLGWKGPLGQVFLNLIVNARQALGGPGRIGITSAVVDGQVVVTVTDSGSGLPPGDPEQLFAPGWTTKSEDDGTGLGLFISRKIIRQHPGGSLTAANGPAGGAVFTVTLQPFAAGHAGDTA
jgi:signal transduction histidine kinase